MLFRAAHLLSLSLLLAWLPAWAQDGGTPIGVLTKTPALLKQVEAIFPAEALDAGSTGAVELEIDLGADGKVMDARVVRSAGAAFDEAALQAIRQFEFSPAEVDGVPAAVRIQYRYEFVLRTEVVQTPLPPAPEVVNFQGLLLERGTRRPLPLATLVVDVSGAPLETTSDQTGHFQLRNVPAGSYRVLVSSPEHARYEVQETFTEGQRTEVTYYVRKKVYTANETVVRDRRERKEVAQISLQQEEIRLIPGTQGDALKVVQNLPGVARSPFSFGLLVVRGGKPWDSRTYVDDALIPLLFHFGGLYATFNSSLVEEISFQPGNFGAEFGRSIAGLVKADTRTPAQESLHGYFDVSLIDTSALVEGPVSEEWSLSASARRSYVDAVLPFALNLFVPQAKNTLSFTVAPQYWDYQLRAERRPKGGRDRLSISLFGSNDRVAFVLPNPSIDPEGRSRFETLIAYHRLVVNYDRKLTDNLRLVSHHSLGLDQANFSGGSDLFSNSYSQPVQAREALEWDIWKGKGQLTVGADLYLIPFQYSIQSPPRFKLNQIPDPFLSRTLVKDGDSGYSFEPAAFAELVWKPLSWLKLVGGARLDYETMMKDAWFDPRLGAFFQVGQRTTLKASAGLFHQPPDYRQGLLTEKFGNPNLLPEASEQYAVGWEQKLTDALGLDLQLYYKNLRQQSQAALAAAPGEPVNPDTAELRFTSDGRGRSYGLELLLRQQLTRNFFGWIAYSLSRSERYYAVDGAWGLHPLDQPHNLIALASYKLPLDFIVGARVRYASGALDTPTEGAIYDVNGNYYFPLSGKRYSRRLPDFVQLDVRVDRKFVFERWMLSLYVDVQNATNRQNVEGVMGNYDYSEERYIYGLPIIPSLGIRGEY